MINNARWNSTIHAGIELFILTYVKIKRNQFRQY